MNREQMIAWLALEGVYVQDYLGNGNLYEAYVHGRSTSRFYGSLAPDTWCEVSGKFSGGPDVAWEKLADDVIAELYAVVVDYVSGREP